MVAPAPITDDIEGISSTGNVEEGNPVGGSAAPYTPAQVAAAAKTTTPTSPSQFSSGTLAAGSGNTQTAVSTAAAALSGQTPPTPTPPVSMAVGVGTPGTPGYQTVSVTPNKQYQYQLSNGQIISVTDPTINQSALAGATFLMGPTGSEANPLASTSAASGSAPLPSGITAGTPDSSGNISYTGNNVTAKLPSNQANASTLLGYANQVVQDNPGSSVSLNADGSAVLTLQGGTTVQLSPNTLASPSSYGQAVSAASNTAQANSAAQATATAQISAINQQLTETLQQLQQQQDAAEGEEGAATGGFGKAGETGVSARYDQLVQNAKNDAQDEIAEINANLASAQSTNTNNLTSQLAQIEQSAQGTAIGLQQTAQSNFLNVAKTFDVSTATMPTGQSLSTLTIGANGSTGVAAVDALVKQGIQAGYSPQQALSLVQAGVATQNKNNQAQFLGLLQQASYANGWATMTSQQLQGDPLFNAYVGMAQSYIPSLANNPQAAAALVSGGTEAQQKLAIAGTGSPTGASGQVPATVLPPSATLSDTDANTPGLAGSIAANTKYSPNAIYQSALQYALDGKTPPMGLGTAAEVQNARAAVVNTAGAIAAAAGVTLPQLQAEYAANEDALTTILPSTNQTILNATNAQTNFTNLIGLANTMDNNTPTLATPLLERWLQTGQIELGNDAEVNNFVSYLSTSLTEYAKVVTGQTSGAGVTDTANAQLQSLLNSGLSPTSIQSWVSNVAQPAMQSRVSASIGQVSDISSTIGNLLSVTANGVTAGGTTGGEGGSGSSGTDSSGAPSGWDWPTSH